MVGRYTSGSLRCIFSVIVVGVPSEAVRTMADPRGGRREKVKINENSSSAGAIEKLPGTARRCGTRGCELGEGGRGFETCWREYFFPPAHPASPPRPSLSVSAIPRSPSPYPYPCRDRATFRAAFRCANSTVGHAPSLLVPYRAFPLLTRPLSDIAHPSLPPASRTDRNLASSPELRAWISQRTENVHG